MADEDVTRSLLARPPKETCEEYFSEARDCGEQAIPCAEDATRQLRSRQAVFAAHSARFPLRDPQIVGRFAKGTVRVTEDVGGGKGRGVEAARRLAEGEVVFEEAPVAAIQHFSNASHALVCAACFRCPTGAPNANSICRAS